MAGRGGARKGAGRKSVPKPTTPEVRVGSASALRILRELDHEKALIELYRACKDARLKVHILFRLREWAFGKPTEPAEPLGFDPSAPLRVIVEHIGSHGGSSNPAAAKAK